MPRKEIITNTWTCDGLNCSSPPSSESINPFVTVRVHKPNREDLIPIEIDLCPACILTITAPVAVSAIAQMLQPPEP